MKMRKFGAGMRDGSGYAAGVRLGNAKSARWLHRKDGGRCEGDRDDLGNVEGREASRNLGRPGRKAGGSIKDADDCYAAGGKIKPGFIKHPGALHKEMGVPAGDKIPAKKLDKATHSSNPTLKKRAVLAKTMKSWNHK